MNYQQPEKPQHEIVKRQHVYEELTKEYIEREYQHREFPKWKYHTDGKETLVTTRDEEKGLGVGWTDKPTGKTKAPDAAALQKENEELRQQLAAVQKGKTPIGGFKQ